MLIASAGAILPGKAIGSVQRAGSLLIQRRKHVEREHAASLSIPDRRVLETCSCDNYKQQNMKAAREHHLYAQGGGGRITFEVLAKCF